MTAQPNPPDNLQPEPKDSDEIAVVFADAVPLSDEHIDALSSITTVDEEVILAGLLKRNPQLYAFLVAEED